MITLDIFADPTCPWSYLAKSALDRALEARPDHPLVLAWHPFQLHPTLPPEGMPRAAYLRARFGADVAREELALIEAAKAAGVALDLAAVTHVPNSRDAHRLVYWAGIEGRQTPVMAGLMRAYWRAGRDIGHPAELVAIGTAAGLDGAVLRRLLGSDADLDTIARHESHARERGISALPTFILGHTHVITGFQTHDFWLSVLDEISAA